MSDKIPASPTPELEEIVGLLRQIASSMPKISAPPDPREVLTVEEFAERIKMPEAWVRLNQKRLPGRICHSQKVIRFHWATYVAKALETGSQGRQRGKGRSFRRPADHSWGLD